MSAFIPCYNYERYVATSIESLLRQTIGEALELVIVDDASTDGSWGVIERYASDTRVRLVRHTKNLGHLATYDDAMANCTANLIVGLSADDVCLDPDALRKQVALLDAHPGVGFVYTDILVIDERDRVIGARRIPTPEVQSGKAAFEQLFFGNFIPHLGTMARRQCFAELGSFDRALYHSADWELWLRFASRFDVGHVREPLYGYRIHGGNMHIVPDHSSGMEDRRQLLEKALAYTPDTRFRRHLRHSMAVGHGERAHLYMRTGRMRLGFADLATLIRLDARALRRSTALTAIAYAFARPAVLWFARMRSSLRARIGAVRAGDRQS